MKIIKIGRKPIKCIHCGNKTVVKILYGEPTPEAVKLEREGKIVLGGCMVSEKNPDWHCTHCKTEYKK